MYRISIIKSSSIYTKGYFGPCSEEDVMSPEEIAKYRNPSNYFDISNFFSDESRLDKLKQLLVEAGVGSKDSWAAFRNNKNYVLKMCSRGDKTHPDIICFLRPEYAAYLNFSGGIIRVNTWNQLTFDNKKFLQENNVISDQRDSKNRFGDDVLKITYTGSVKELLEYQSKVGQPPHSVNVWGRYLEGIKEIANQYNIDSKLRRINAEKRLLPEEKQQLYNHRLEESFYGLQAGEKLYKYTLDPESDIAQLTVEHSGKSKTRNIAKDGFTKKEWQSLVLGGKLPAAIKKGTPDNEVEKILNGVIDSVDRVTTQPKIRYTGEHPHTLEKMRLTGLSPNQYYTQNEWYNSLLKVEVLEDKIDPFNKERQRRYKKDESEMPLETDYKAALENLDLEKELGLENVKKNLTRVGARFRKKLERDGINDVKSKLEEIKSESTDTFAIKQFMLDLQNLDNLFIDSCYTKQIGSTGEKVLKQTLSKSLGPEYKYQRTLSINVYPSGSKEAYLLIFDGAILKSGNIVMLFEVQGNQHYSFNNRHYKTYNDFQQRLFRDKLKLDFCRQNNIPLFTVSNILDSSEAASIYSKLATSGALGGFIPKGSKADYNFSNLSEENIDEWVGKYVDTLVVSHFNPIINTNSYENLIPKINRIMVDLSKLVMIAITNKYNSQMEDTSFMQGFSKETLLDEGHKMLVDSFNKYFGNKYRMDYQNNVTYLGQVLKPKPVAEEPLPVQEMAFVRHKKRYKIKRIR
jgi:hypothetical protein